MSRRAIEWAARLYPASWRQRYGAEFGALLEESGGGWSAAADVFRGALAMQTRTWSIWKFVAVCGLIGAAIAGVASWRTPKHYVSTAVLRVDADYWSMQRLGQIVQEVLTRSSLEGIIVKNDLYKADRVQKPMEDIVQDMRRDITIRPVSGEVAQTSPTVAFEISYTAGSPAEARRVANLLASQFIDTNWKIRTEMAAAHDFSGFGVRKFEVLDPASSTPQPTAAVPSRWIATGLSLGLLVGVLGVVFRRWPLVAAAGVVGSLIAGGILLALPREYVSVAVVTGDVAQNAHALASDEALLGLIQNPAFNLYPEERGKMAPAALAARVRRDLTIRPIQRPFGATPLPHPVVAISFAYPDRVVAQAVTRDFVARLGGVSAIEVLDAPSYPDRPTNPNPVSWVSLGLVLGLLGGIALTWRRSRNSPALAQA